MSCHVPHKLSADDYTANWACPLVLSFKPTAEHIHLNGRRALFGSGKPDQVTALEAESLSQLRHLIQQRKLQTQDPAYSNDSIMLRFLQGNEWKLEDALRDLQRYVEWRVGNLPVVYTEVQKALADGLLYIHGRDRLCRPLLVLRSSILSTVRRVSIENLNFGGLLTCVYEITGIHSSCGHFLARVHSRVSYDSK
eukprot:Lankesteria_metandrocarpae@DN3022_c0_g1_i1.p1